VKAKEPYTINYEFYLNSDETRCIVHETYANSEAILAHNAGVALQTILPKIFSVSRISRFDVYGNPSEDLQFICSVIDSSALGFRSSYFYGPEPVCI
jgi:hypothetical protein